MFKKLRNRLILINLGITSFVIVVVFATIYIVSTKTAENRPLRMQNPNNIVFEDKNNDGVPDDFEDMMSFAMRQEKKNAADNLLVILILSGIAIEIVVALISYFLAEEAIKPIKDAYESQRFFIANASHEIKTPLAAITANLEAAEIKDNKWIKNIEVEAEKLTKLNSKLLTLASADLVDSTSVEEIDLKPLVNKILDSFESRLKDKKLTRKINLNKKVRINSTDFEQILSILMDNAIKYSNKTIIVQLDEHSLSVSNDGKKIPAGQLSQVFERFYQVDKTAEGFGLGLSIAAALATRNHYKLHVGSSKYTTFTLFF